jgi:hypothetical protein
LQTDRPREVQRYWSQVNIELNQSWTKVDVQVAEKGISLMRLPLMRFPMTINQIVYYMNVLESSQATLARFANGSTAIYKEVPTNVCSPVPQSESTISFEIPKSQSLTSPFLVKRIFPGLTSTHYLLSQGKNLDV